MFERKAVQHRGDVGPVFSAPHGAGHEGKRVLVHARTLRMAQNAARAGVAAGAASA